MITTGFNFLLNESSYDTMMFIEELHFTISQIKCGR